MAIITTYNNNQPENLKDLLAVPGNFPMAKKVLAKLKQTDSPLYSWLIRQFSAATIQPIAEGQENINRFAQEVGLPIYNATQLFAASPDDVSSTLRSTGEKTIEELEAQTMEVFMSQLDQAFTVGTYDDGSTNGIRTTEGVVPFIKTNVEDMTTKTFDRKSINNLVKKVVKKIKDKLAESKDYAILVNTDLFFEITEMYKVEPADRSVAGADIATIITPAGRITVELSVNLPEDVLLLVPADEVSGRYIPVNGDVIREHVLPEKGFGGLTPEVKAEIGTDFGNEFYYAKMINITLV